jgi:hypothetical protein
VGTAFVAASADAGAGALARERIDPPPRLSHATAAKSPWAGHYFDACRPTLEELCAWRGVKTMVTELQTKVEKYETRASKCEEQARQATEKSQQNFYEVLAGYYRSLAADFRKIIEKRNAA